MSAQPQLFEERIRELEQGFSRYLVIYDERGPFRRAGQLEHHVATHTRWSELGGDPIAAVRDEVFVRSLYRTLGAWGIGIRGSKLRSPSQFWAALRSQEERIGALSDASLSDGDLLKRGIDVRVWELIENLDIVENEARLVALTKTLHHILPRLVVPIDRTYTGRFFGWSPVVMQSRQHRRFTEMFAVFHRIAMAVDLDSGVGEGWRMSPAKLIDNALVAYCLTELEGKNMPVPVSLGRAGKYSALRELLSGSSGTVELTFVEIDELVGDLPPSARSYREWWANATRNVQAHAWLDAGKRVAMVNLTSERVRFTPTTIPR